MTERYELCVLVGLCLETDGRVREAVRYIHTCAKVLSPEPDLISFIKLHATTAAAAAATIVVAATAYDEVSLRLLEVS
jgi:hypothetical protein